MSKAKRYSGPERRSCVYCQNARTRDVCKAGRHKLVRKVYVSYQGDPGGYYEMQCACGLKSKAAPDDDIQQD